MITPRSANSGIQAGDTSITSSAPDLARCSAIALVRMSANGASVTLIVPPVSLFQSGPEKFFGSRACGPTSAIRLSVTSEKFAWAAATALVAIGSVPSEAASAAFACSAAMKNGPAAAAAAMSFALSIRKLLRGICPASSPSVIESSKVSCMSSLTPPHLAFGRSLMARCTTGRSFRFGPNAVKRHRHPLCADAPATLGIEEPQRTRPDSHLRVLVLLHPRVHPEPADQRRPPHAPLVVEGIQQRRLVDLLR